MTQPLHQYDGDNGMRSVITIGHNGRYHVQLQDVDADLYLPTVYIYPTLQQATIKAKEIIS